MNDHSVYINELKWLSGQKSMRSHIEEVAPTSIVYTSGLLDFSSTDENYLDLHGDLNRALDWLLTEISQVDTSKVDEIVLATSTLNLEGAEVSRLWEKLISPERFPVLSNAVWCQGKGCNILTYATGRAFAKTRASAGAVLIVCLEVHKEGASRLSDYAFFSDAVAFLLVSSRPTGYEILASDTLILVDSKKFAFNCRFAQGSYLPGTRMHTLNTFPFLLSRKYQDIPEGLSYTPSPQVKVHHYALDPFIDLVRDSDAGSTSSLIHVESPPFHVDELRLRRLN